jgi:hypothetical protein
MNHEAVLKFFETIRTDEAASQRLRAAGDDVTEFLRLSVELGRERGFKFDAAQLKEALDDLSAQSPESLSDEDLAAVAGGRQWSSYDVRQVSLTPFRQLLPRTLLKAC